LLFFFFFFFSFSKNSRALDAFEQLASENEEDVRVKRELLHLSWQLNMVQETIVWGEKISVRSVGDNWILGCAYESSGGRKQASRCFMNVLRENELAVEALEALCRVGAAAQGEQNMRMMDSLNETILFYSVL
jgi:hypothetical protein